MLLNNLPRGFIELFHDVGYNNLLVLLFIYMNYTEHLPVTLRSNLRRIICYQ